MAETLVVPSKSPVQCAPYIVRHVFGTVGGLSRLLYWKRTWWYWGGSAWGEVAEEWVGAQVHKLGALQVGRGDDAELWVINNRVKSDLVEGLRSTYMKELVWPRLLGWKGAPMDSPVGFLVRFEDCIVDVWASAQLPEGSPLVTYPEEYRPYLFSPVTVRTRWDMGEGEPTTWNRCMEQWSEGDSDWVETRERMYGYALLTDRRYQKWLVEVGKTRSGKGTGTNDVLKPLLGDAMMCMTSTSIKDTFGLQGLENASVLVMTEADGRAFRGAEGLVKSITGGDAIPIRRLYRGATHVPVRAFPIAQANDMLEMRDAGEALSARMEILPFNRSFKGEADPNLGDKLRGELPQIARRLVEAAVRYVRAGGEVPGCGMASEKRREFHQRSNWVNAFIDSCCVVREEGWVTVEQLRDRVAEWVDATEIVPTDGEGRQLRPNQWASHIARNHAKLRKARVGPHDHRRVIKGISLRVNRDYEVH